MVQWHSQQAVVRNQGHHAVAYVSLANVLEARPAGITEPETWALLCQAVQALQDLFLSDGVSGGRHLAIVSPTSLLLSARGRVHLALPSPWMTAADQHATSSYTAPELQINLVHKYSDNDIEKMLVYSVGCCLTRAALTSRSAAARLSAELCAVLSATAHPLPEHRATLMHLLDVISEYSKRREQVKPFSHIVMDLYRETIIYRNSKPTFLPDCALQPNFKQHLVQPCSQNRNDLLSRKVEPNKYNKTISSDKWMRNMFASLEHLNQIPTDQEEAPVLTQRPKSICTNEELKEATTQKPPKRKHMKRNPVKRAASRLYHVQDAFGVNQRQCIGPEFVIRAALPCKQIFLEDIKTGGTKILTIIMLNGVKIEINCKPEVTTAGQLFEKIIRSEGIEENYFLGLSILISGDFVFLPSDIKLSKVLSNELSSDIRFTLFVRIRFFLPSLRGIRSQQSRHLLYLQLRRSLLENQLPCSLEQLYELGGLALQAEFGDYSPKHETHHYFLLEHYIPEMMIETNEQFRKILTEAHIHRKGLSIEKAEEDFILLAQSLPNYGVHFYSATLVSKNNNRDLWLCVSAQGINLYVRTGSVIPYSNLLIHETFKWQDIQTLCYSKQFLCILPRHISSNKNSRRKFKLKMDHKKSYYTFRLASLHHQFFLRLRTEYTSLQSLSQQFGILLKDIKNEANSLFKLATNNPKNIPPVNHFANRTSRCKRSKSVHELNYTNIPLEEFQNKENELPKVDQVDSRNKVGGDKRKGVKMGIRAFTSNGRRMSRSLEAVNAWTNDEQEKLSLQSSRISNSSLGVAQNADIYVLNSSIRSLDDQFLPDFHETLSQSLLDKLKNLSFADERILKPVTLLKDSEGSLGIQVTEGSDGKVYIQSVVPFGPANQTGNVFKGDQIVAVDGQNLLNLKYSDALHLLKKTDNKVELILSQCLSSPLKTNSKFVCDKVLNNSLDFYNNMLKYNDTQTNFAATNVQSMKLQYVEEDFQTNDNHREMVNQVALPRSLGLSRRWRGPVRYPVTPVKSSSGRTHDLNTSDEEQIFI